MKIRKVFLTATAVLGLSALLAGGVLAQTSAPAAKPARAARAKKEYSPRVLKQLEDAKIELTAEQKTKLKALTDKTIADRKALQDKHLATDEQRKQMMELGRKFRTDAMAVLTDAQKEQLKTARPARRSRANAAKPADKTTTPAPAR